MGAQTWTPAGSTAALWLALPDACVPAAVVASDGMGLTAAETGSKYETAVGSRRGADITAGKLPVAAALPSTPEATATGVWP